MSSIFRKIKGLLFGQPRKGEEIIYKQVTFTTALPPGFHSYNEWYETYGKSIDPNKT